MKNFLPVLLITLLVSCKKETVEELPAATQTGAHTFGARVDGKIWIPQQFGPFSASNLLEARYLGDNLYIKAQNFSSSPVETEFDLTLIGVTGPGTYLLNVDAAHPSHSYNYGYYVKRNLSPTNEWITSSLRTGSITLTRLDTAAKIVSGTFQFSGEDIRNPGSVISVTEGRFDIKW
jgi:hypothetical protein